MTLQDKKDKKHKKEKKEKKEKGPTRYSEMGFGAGGSDADSADEDGVALRDCFCSVTVFVP